MRVLGCGSRDWSDEGVILMRLALLSPDTVIVEGCARGADRIIEWAAGLLGLRVEHHPANWALGRRAGLRRTLAMLDYPMPELVIAFRLGVTPGTAFTVNTARRRGIAVEEIWAK